MTRDADLSTERDVLLTSELQELRRRRAWIGCILTLTLVPAGAALDLAAYPQLFVQLLAGRIACVAIVLPIFVFLFFERSRPYARALGLAWGLAPALAISWMIYLTEGSLSPFYAGLNLVILGTCVLLPFTALEAALYCGAVYASYAAASALHSQQPFHAAAFTMHSIFIGMTSAICVTASHFVSGSRRHEFDLRYALGQQNERLTELDRMKTQFFANVSHELRTPITLVLAPVERLLQEGDSLPAALREQLLLVRRNAQRLLHLIDDLLELIRFDSATQRMDLRDVEVSGLLGALAESISLLAEAKGVAVHYQHASEAVWVQGDLRQLERLFLNLLTNAVKFTDSGGSIRLSAAASEGRVVVTVADTGSGIASADLPHIFERFRQAGNPLRGASQGLGIGLALVKEIVELHGGSVEAQSAPGRGTTFVVRLPQAARPQSPAETPSTEAVDRASRSVLVDRLAQPGGMAPVEPIVAAAEQIDAVVVDDEPDMCRFLTSVLGRQFTVRGFDSSPAAFAWLSQSRWLPRVIVTDHMMPAMDGLELCRRVKQLPGADFVKLLMVTARVDDTVKLEALRSGVDDFLTKPFSAVELETRVANLADNARLQRGLAQNNAQLQQALCDLREAESQLIQTAKMSSIGTLSAGLLHEINNPLNHTLMAVNYCRDVLLPGLSGGDASQPLDELHDSLRDIESGMARIARIIVDLRQFAYPEQAGVPNEFPLRRAIETSLRFTAHELAGIDVQQELADDRPACGSETQIVQVLVNLLLNAADGIRAHPASRPGKVVIRSTVEGSRLLVELADNGVGIQPEHLPRLFEPFFTTKEVGAGMGLGLSISHTIVQRHGSTLIARSTPGEGTEFLFDLPLAGENGDPHVEPIAVDAGAAAS